MTYNSSKTGAQVDSVVDAGLPGGSTLYGVSNLLGTVSQSGGVPTGAVIERGSNANGEFVKFADGTLICTITNVTLAFVTAARLAYTWTFPSAFVSFGAGFVTVASSTYTNGSARGNEPWIDSVSGTGARFSFISNNQFSVGDTATGGRIMAIGRWF